MGFDETKECLNFTEGYENHLHLVHLTSIKNGDGIKIVSIQSRFIPQDLRIQNIGFASVVKDLKYAESHEWVKVEGKSGIVCITDHAQDHLFVLDVQLVLT